MPEGGPRLERNGRPHPFALQAPCGGAGGHLETLAMRRNKVGLYGIARPTVKQIKAHEKAADGGWPLGRRKVVVLRWNARDGKRMSETLPPRTTLREAKRMQGRRQAEIDEGAKPKHELGHWPLDEFVKADQELAEAELRPRSMSRLEKAGEYLVACLGAGFNAHDVEWEHALRFRKYLARQKAPSGELLSAATVARLYGAAQGIFSRMADLGKVQGNPLSSNGKRKRRRRPSDEQPEVVVFSMDEVRAIVEAAPNEWWEDFTWLAVGSGLDQEELLTLAWADVKLPG